MLLDCLESGGGSKIRKEIIYIKQHVGENDEICMLDFARLAYANGNYQDALEKATKFQKYMTKTYGSNYSSVAKMYVVKLECFVRLKNKESARKCLKRLKKHVKLQDYKSSYKHWEKIVKSMPSKTILTNVPVRTVEKCAYYGCQKMERYVREFHVCSKCQAARYCSTKCQRKHWKSGHKQNCFKWNKGQN